ALLHEFAVHHRDLTRGPAEADEAELEPEAKRLAEGDGTGIAHAGLQLWVSLLRCCPARHQAYRAPSMSGSVRGLASALGRRVSAREPRGLNIPGARCRTRFRVLSRLR